MTSSREHVAYDPWLAAIVESSDSAILTKDLGGLTTSWNGAAERLFGYRASEVIGHPMMAIFPLERGEEESSIIDRIGCGELVDHFETNRRHKDGQIVKVSITISTIRDKYGVIIGTLNILRDLTDSSTRDQRIEELQAKLEHDQRLKDVGNALSALIQEISLPLTTIINYGNACRHLTVMADQEMVQSALKCIVDQANRTWEIAQRIGGFVKKGDFEMRVEILPQVVGDTVVLGRSTAKREDLTPATKLNQHGLHVEIAKVQVQ
jgi:PAS domain S-box-containing protein